MKDIAYLLDKEKIVRINKNPRKQFDYVQLIIFPSVDSNLCFWLQLKLLKQYL